jgi:excisionase family DNA binding protein
MPPSYALPAWPTAEQVAAKLGVSKETVRALVHRGRLTPRYTIDRCVRFEPSEIEEFAKTYRPKHNGGGGALRRKTFRAKGELAARIAQMMRERKTIADMVIELRVDGLTIHEIIRSLEAPPGEYRPAGERLTKDRLQLAREQALLEHSIKTTELEIKADEAKRNRRK